MVFFYTLIWAMPLAQHPFWTRFAGDLTVIKYVGIACVLYACFYLGARRTIPPYVQTRQARLFLLFFVLASLSYWAKGSQFSWETSPFLTYLSFLVLFFITLAVVDSPGRLRNVLLCIIGSVGFASLYVIREWQKYHDVYPGFRPGWIAGDSNYFAASALFSLSIGFCLMRERRPIWERMFCLACLVATLVAVTLAASRGGFLGLVAAFSYLVWRSRQRARNVALAVILLIPLSLSLPISPVRRLLYPSHSDKESEENHKAAWKAGLRMIEAHPLAGVGLGNFKAMMPLYSDAGEKVDTIAHNVYLEIGAETGLPGLLAFLAILYFSYTALEEVRRRTLRAHLPLLHQAAVGTQAALIGYSVASFFLSAELQKLFWLVVFVSACLPHLVSRVLTVRESSTARAGQRPPKHELSVTLGVAK